MIKTLQDKYFMHLFYHKSKDFTDFKILFTSSEKKKMFRNNIDMIFLPIFQLMRNKGKNFMRIT